MSYFFEVWLRDYAKDYLRDISIQDDESYHPHITLVRPFKILTDEADIKEKVIAYCETEHAIRFGLEGKGSFENNITYIPVVNNADLLKFSDELEKILENFVEFAPKLGDKKILHATVDAGREIDPCPWINEYMLRLTGIKDKMIWFSYDFMTREVLDREESLDKQRWKNTVYKVSDDNALIRTIHGFERVDKT